MLKTTMRRLLPLSMYEGLAAVKRASCDEANGLLVKGLALLPQRSQLAIRAGLHVVTTLDHPSANVRLALESDVEAGLRAYACAKEPATVRWIETMFAAGDVFYDIGANVGAYALLAARLHRGDVRTYAFEPSFANYSQLCRNVILNGCADSVVPLPIALSSRTALDTFHYSDLRAGAARHLMGADADGGVGIAAHTVCSWRLDDLIARFDLPTPRHLKIDVDGHETAVLSGAEATLGDRRLRSVVVEVLAGSDSERTCLDTLTRYGFSVHSRERYAIRHGAGGDAYNYLLVRGRVQEGT